MDTATHLAVGIGLAGLAHADPVVAADPQLATAVFVGTVAASQAPDTDTLLRLRSNALYIRNHRGPSHSIPAIFVWTALITLATAWITGTENIGHLAFWTLLAVCIHVWQDLFNAYGTQAIWPFSNKWIAWNIIHIFDPVIFISHLAAIMLWILRAGPPQTIFIVLYIFLIAYYIWRTLAHAFLERKLTESDADLQPGERYHIFPTYKLGIWNVVKQLGDGSFRIGEWSGGKLQWIEHVESDAHPAVDISKTLPDISALLYLTDFACAECIRHKWGYEVRWTDIRYRHRKQYPFVAIALFDSQLKVLDSYVGWKSGAKLEKKLNYKQR